MLLKRVSTATVLGALVVGAILALPTGAVAGVSVIVAIGAAWEWQRLGAKGAPSVTDWAYAFGVGLLAAVGWKLFESGIIPIWIAGILWIALLAWVCQQMLEGSQPRGAPGKLLGVVVIAPALALAPYLHGQAGFGPELLLTICVVVWAGDIGAFFVGRAWGRNRLAPTISPGKTIEGALGGVALSVVAGVACAKWFGLPLASIILFALTVVGAGFVGVLADLLESIIKRRAGKKDSGSLLPGHGGVLDRIDSLLGVIPVFAAAWVYWLSP